MAQADHTETGNVTGELRAVEVSCRALVWGRAEVQTGEIRHFPLISEMNPSPEGKSRGVGCRLLGQLPRQGQQQELTLSDGWMDTGVVMTLQASQVRGSMLTLSSMADSLPGVVSAQ